MSLCRQNESKAIASAQLTIKATIWRAGLGLRESDSGLFLN